MGTGAGIETTRAHRSHVVNGRVADPSTDTLTGRSVLRGVAVFAWITWAWSTVATALGHERVEPRGWRSRSSGPRWSSTS